MRFSVPHLNRFVAMFSNHKHNHPRNNFSFTNTIQCYFFARCKCHNFLSKSAAMFLSTIELLILFIWLIIAAAQDVKSNHDCFCHCRTRRFIFSGAKRRLGRRCAMATDPCERLERWRTGRRLAWVDTYGRHFITVLEDMFFHHQ
jgi:hypothetical protein